MIQKSPVKGLLLLSLLCVICVMTGLLFGSKSLTVHDVWQYFFSTIENYQQLVIHHRVPRTLGALLCGAALGVASTLVQGLTKNPLADTGLLGINAGASAAIVTLIFVPSLPISPFFAAFLGAVCVASFISVIGSSSRELNFARLILVGAALSACLYAYVQAVSQLSPNAFEQYKFWASGSFTGIRYEEIYQLSPYFVALIIMGGMLGKYVNIIALGNDLARSVGVNVFLIQIFIICTSAGLSALTVAWVGPIAFVGLGAVYLARWVVGADYRVLLWASMLTGASLLTLADTLARIVISPSELSTGIVTGFIGAPLLYLSILHKRKGR